MHRAHRHYTVATRVGCDRGVVQPARGAGTEYGAARGDMKAADLTLVSTRKVRPSTGTSRPATDTLICKTDGLGTAQTSEQTAASRQVHRIQTLAVPIPRNSRGTELGRLGSGRKTRFKEEDLFPEEDLVQERRFGSKEGRIGSRGQNSLRRPGSRRKT